MRALTNIPLQFQAATKNHLGRVLKRLENHPTPSISEEEGGDQVSQHLVVKFTSSKLDKPQDFKVDLGLFKLYPALGYLHYSSYIFSCTNKRWAKEEGLSEELEEEDVVEGDGQEHGK